MKKISLVLVLALSVLVTTAQTWTKVNGRWEYQYMRFDNTVGTFTPPTDTISTAATGSIAVKNDVFYFKNLSGKWVAGSAGITDLIKRSDSIFSNSISPANFKYRDSVRWGVVKSKVQDFSSVNKRNDAGHAIRTPSGRLICAYTSFGSNSGDADSAIIVTKISDDNGATWLYLDTAVGVAAHGNYIPSMYFNPGKDTLRMMYLRAIDANTNQMYGTYCTNFTSNSLNWSAPALVYGDGSEYYSPAADRVLVLKNGTYLFPLPVHISGELASGAGRYDGYLLKSTNGGATWGLVPGVRIISPDTLFVETGLTQTDDPLSLVQMYGRTRSGQAYMAQSTDGSATSFDIAYPWGLFCNNSTVTVKYLEEYKAFVGIYNRYKGTGTINGLDGRDIMDVSIKKVPLPSINMAIAADGFSGQWQFLYRIDSTTGRNFIEPSITLSDNEMLVVYSDGNTPDADSYNLKIKKIPYYLISGATANQYAQQLVLQKTFIGTDANFIEMRPNGFSPTAAYGIIGNQTSGSSTNFGMWFNFKAAGSIAANPLLMTLTGNCFDGAMWIDANNNGSDINNSARILRLTNSGSSSLDERFSVYGDGSQRLNNSVGEFARWFGSTGNLAINTAGADNGQKLQVDGSTRLKAIGLLKNTTIITDTASVRITQNIRNAADNADSVTRGFFAGNSETDLFHYRNSFNIGSYLKLYESSNKARAELAISDNFASDILTNGASIQLKKGNITLVSSDSLQIHGVPSASADSLYGVGHYDGTSGTNIVLKVPYAKRYTALLTQSGTGDPSAIVLENGIGTIVWTRNSSGNYTGTLSGAFTANKTWLICQKGDGSGSFVNGLLSRSGANTVTLDVRDNSDVVTDNFTNLSIEIRVYP